jgi:hypothetical protein
LKFDHSFRQAGSSPGDDESAAIRSGRMPFEAGICAMIEANIEKI